MVIGQWSLERLVFPGEAGELQRQGRQADFIAELGVNYAGYHSFLVKLARDLGPRPDPQRYRTDPDGYFAACALRQEIHVAEEILRRCRAYRQSGRSTDEAAPDRAPIIDARNRVVSAETGTADASDPGFDDPAGWRPPQPLLPGESH